MHSSTHAALALLLLAAQGAHAQAPLPAGFVDAAAVVDGLVVDMRYFGANNFVGERIDGYEGPRCLLSAPAANALAAVERDLAARGLGLKVFDCYRPQRAVLLRLVAHASIRRPRFRAEEIERRAHIELAGVRAPHQREIDGRAARVTGAIGNIAFLEQLALVLVGIEFAFALDVLDPLRPAHESGDRALRPVAIEHFEAESAHRKIALDRGQRIRRRHRQ